MIPRLLSVVDLAARLGFSESAIYRLTALRRIPFVKIGGRVWFTEADVEQWLEARKVLAGPVAYGTPVPARPRERSRADECQALGISVDHRFS